MKQTSPEKQPLTQESLHEFLEVVINAPVGIRRKLISLRNYLNEHFKDIDKEEATFGSFEPKKDNRFTVTFGKPFNIPKYVIHETTRPCFTKSNSGIKWNNMVFKMYDPVHPSTSQAIMEGLRELRKLDSQTINITLEVLGPVGDTVEQWVITGEIETVDFGHLHWAGNEPLMVHVYFKVHSAVLNY